MKYTPFILACIILLAAVLRLVHPFSIPFTVDEMSAITRTHYSNIHDEILKGVMLNDTHPAGVQVFLYYWTKLFGYSEFAVKLPFIICGIFSVYLIFRLGEEWFNQTVGLICAAYLATIEYTIMYSQVARPYSSGLFLSLAMVWFWYKVIFKPENKYYQNLVLYVLFSALCAYNHHFSLLFAAIVGFTGAFFVRGKYLLKYALAGLCIFILYIPHLHIFFYQLKQGGVEDWLGKPGNTFIIEYIQYILQFSIVAYLLAGFLLLLGLINILKKPGNNSPSGNQKPPFYFISLVLFLIPFLVGFFYSKYVNAVLQYSVLIFSFPFMLFCVFGLLPDLKIKAQITLVLLICSVNVFALVHDRKYYTIFYELQNERQVIINDSIEKKAGNNNVILLAQATPDSITAFYSRKYHTVLPYLWMPDSSGKQPLINYLEKHKTSYLTYDYMAGSDPLYLPIILNYYPYITLANYCHEGTNYVLASQSEVGQSPYVFESKDDYVKPDKYWSDADRAFLSDTISLEAMSYRMDSLHEWAPGFTDDLSNMTTSENDLILVSLNLFPLEKLNDVFIVSSIEFKDSSIYWHSTPATYFLFGDSLKKWQKAYLMVELNGLKLTLPNLKVKIYIWNKGKKNFYMTDFEVKTLKGNPVLYALWQKF